MDCNALDRSLPVTETMRQMKSQAKLAGSAARHGMERGIVTTTDYARREECSD